MDIEFMMSNIPKLLSATIVTIKLLSASLLFGIIVGTVFAIFRVSKNKWARFY